MKFFQNYLMNESKKKKTNKQKNFQRNINLGNTLQYGSIY